METTSIAVRHSVLICSCVTYRVVVMTDLCQEHSETGLVDFESFALGNATHVKVTVGQKTNFNNISLGRCCPEHHLKSFVFASIVV